MVRTLTQAVAEPLQALSCILVLRASRPVQDLLNDSFVIDLVANFLLEILLQLRFSEFAQGAVIVESPSFIVSAILFEEFSVSDAF